jgi:curli biogenesis system outer membrane secretion channel CsgG
VRKSLVVTLCCAFVVAAFAAAGAANDKPRIAVIEFKNKADNQWWYSGGAEAAQDVFVTELVKSGRFRVVEREQLQALMQEKNLALAGDIDPSTAVRAGRLLGVDYILTGAVTEYGVTQNSVDTPSGSLGGRWVPGVSVGKNNFVAAMNARLIETETGEIVWADEGRGEEGNARVRVGGFGGGVDHDSRMFDKVMKPIIQQLVASLKSADI